MTNTPDELHNFLGIIGKTYSEDALDELDHRTAEAVFEFDVAKAMHHFQMLGDYLLSKKVGMSPEAVITAISKVGQEYVEAFLEEDEDNIERGTE